MTLTSNSSNSTRRPAPAGVRSVFLAGPFMGLVDPGTNRMATTAQLPFVQLIEHFESQGLQVYNAHRREAWGAEMIPPDRCTALDQEEIGKADVFVALPGIPASPGTHIEMGWASAFGKPIVLLLEDGREEEYGFLVRGLRSVATVEYVRYTEVRDVLGEVDAAVRRAVDRLGTSS
ncbi:nucleoside 2-deoxyribosyltransferase [Streptomyces sp. NPDC000594]|uniref:nucleoside 2-deoxyribosyltransferase n=1 Tax=Streptomyces sp. NPDC000594 TaxID=3154261 RepID=UPI003320A0C2